MDGVKGWLLKLSKHHDLVISRYTSVAIGGAPTRGAPQTVDDEVIIQRQIEILADLRRKMEMARLTERKLHGSL